MELLDFQRLLATERARRSLSQRDLARLLGLSSSMVALWESGTRKPARENAERWANALGRRLPDDTTGWFSRATHIRQARCGTRNGYERHRRTGEEACPECKAALAAWWRNYRAQKRRDGPS